MKDPIYNDNAEYADNRISLFSAQWIICAVADRKLEETGKIRHRHKTPRSKGGTDKYNNLILVLDGVHRLVHTIESETIKDHLNIKAQYQAD